MSLLSIRRRAHWVALLAAALNALTPLAAAGKHPADGLPFEICSINGPGGDVSLPAAPDGSTAHPAHCALCSASGAKFAALPAAAAEPAEPRVAEGRCPVSADLAHASASPYLPAHPRAPPASPAA
ncbi:MAG: DUF2946 family protein [Vicinamibacteria bacterium]